MPAINFKCPDGEIIEIEKCLKKRECRLNNRCATLPFLRLSAFDREWKGVTPSASGNGPRYLYLKATCNYTVNPQDRVWASIGVGTHKKLSLHKYTNNVLSEEKLSDKEMSGIPDVLEKDENNHGYILSDYKTWGSFKVAKALGIIKIDVPYCDNKGKPIFYKSGKKKGQQKSRKIISIDKTKIDLKAEELQLNRYRIFFEKYGFPISTMQIQAIPRDGGTYIAENRGIDKNIYMIPISKISDDKVIEYYHNLQKEIDRAFVTKYARLCNKWESWDYRRCNGYCEVSENCHSMSNENNEQWVINI